MTLKITEPLKEGDVVTIYEDPVTEQIPEGEAKLVYRLSSSYAYDLGRDMEQWVVQFLEDDPPRNVTRQFLVTKVAK